MATKLGKRKREDTPQEDEKVQQAKCGSLHITSIMFANDLCRLDWTITFPLLVNDGQYGYKTFYMYTTQVKRRSRFFLYELDNYKPDRNQDLHGIEAPDCEIPTFEYYKRCVETGDAVWRGEELLVEVWKTGEVEEGIEDEEDAEDAEGNVGGEGEEDQGARNENGTINGENGEPSSEENSDDESSDGEDSEDEYGEGMEGLEDESDVSDQEDVAEMDYEEKHERRRQGLEPAETPADEENDEIDEEAAAQDAQINNTIIAYCKGHYLAVQLGDCATANLIIDALIDYTVKTKTLFNDYQVKAIFEFGAGSAKLQELAVDIWAFASRAGQVKDRADFGRLGKDFLQDVLLKVYAAVEGAEEKPVAEVFELGRISREKERYHCSNELHPAP